MFKQHLLWALLALSPLALAEPAAAPTPTSDGALAADYLMREFGARMAVPHGKTPRPDKPSANRYSPEQMAAVRTVFGSEDPLQIKRQPAAAGRVDYSITLPARQFQDVNGVLEWEQASIKLTVAPNGSQSISGTVPSFSVTEKQGRFELAGLRSTSTMQADYWTGKSRGEIRKMSFTEAGENGIGFTMEDMRFGSDVKRQGQYYGGVADFTLGRFTTFGHAVDKLHLALRWRKLDAGAMTALKLEVDRMRAEGEAKAKGPEAFARYAPLLKRLILRGAGLEIEDLSASYNGHKVAIKGSLSMPGVTEEDFAAGPAALRKLAGRLDIAVPLPLLRSIAGTMAAHANAGKETTDVPTDKLAAQMYEMMLGKALANQYARLDKDMLRTNIELKDGVLTVNGNAIPLEPLLALLEEKKVPPADTEPPVTISMRDRGLEAAQLFAMNGDRRGLWELCQRLAGGIDTARDPQQAEKWCTKAWDEKEYRAPSQLGELFLDGLLDNPDIPRMVQESADRHAVMKAQYLMYRMYSEGKGMPQDQRKAADYLKKSADQGYQKAVDAMKAADAGYQLPPGDTDAAETAEGPWDYQARAEAGYYDEWNFRFDAAKRRSLSVSMEKLQQHEKWAPLLAVCVSAINPSDVACFNLTGVQGDAQQIDVASNIRGTASHERRNRNALDETFKPGEKFDLQVYTSGRKVHFVVNGQKSLDQEIDFPAEVLTLFCSTADCDFKFKQAN